MATATTAPATFLQHVGAFVKNLLHIGIEVATVAEPEVDLAFPAIAPIYNTAVGLATAAEATASATTGTGPQKLAQLVTNLTPQLDTFLKTNGIVMSTAQVDAWASAVVDSINKIPAPTVAAGAGGVQG